MTTLSTRTEKQRTGNTICVSGNNVTEDFLRNQFTTFGKIVSVSMEIEKGRGFLTFVKTESAERAINDLHPKTVSGISLQDYKYSWREDSLKLNQLITHRHQLFGQHWVR